MNCDACDELIDSYCLAALDEATRGAVERHLRDCPVCRRRCELAAEELSPVEPPPQVKSDLMARIRLSRPTLSLPTDAAIASAALPMVAPEPLIRPAAAMGGGQSPLAASPLAARPLGPRLLGPILAAAASLAGAIVGYQAVRLSEESDTTLRAAVPAATSPGDGITFTMAAIPGPSGAEPAGGYVAFDQLAGQVHICATRLSADRLHVWVTCVDRSEHELGELKPSTDSLDIQIFELPRLPAPVRSLTIAEVGGDRLEAGLGRPVLTVDVK